MDSILNKSIAATRMAGEAIKQYYRSSFDVSEKSPDNPVTDADLAADALLRQELSALVPEAGWLSEETVDDLGRLMKRLVWIVDPLDGTKEFVKGIPEFSISVALVELGRPTLGIVYNPVKDELFYASRDGGTFFNDQAVEVSARLEIEGMRVDASRTETDRGEFEAFAALVDLQAVGSIAYKLARVAAGLADATWSRGPKNEWDICAGTLLVQEAGGRCSDLDDKLFTFNHPKVKVNGIIADNGHLHEELVLALAAHRSSART